MFSRLLTILLKQLYCVLKDSFQLHNLTVNVTLSIKCTVCWSVGFSCMICQLISILSMQFYSELKDRIQLPVLPVTVKTINEIVPFAEAQDSTACFSSYCQSYQCNFTVCWRTEFSCTFCWLLLIISMKFYRVLKDRFQLHILVVTVNPINTNIPCAEGQVSAACFASYCESYQHNLTVRWRTGWAAYSAGYCQSYP